MEEYITVSGESAGEYSEKHSRFLASLFPCETEEQAAEILSRIRSERWDARHHCYAYSLNGGSVKRFSDDGEPHGTAGKPILEVVEASGLTNVLLVVTRYFGGVLLGTGGLVRAYTAAAKEAVAAAKPVKMTLCRVYETVCSYAEHEKLAKLIILAGGRVEKTEFGGEVTLTYDLEVKQCAAFEEQLKEAFSARLTAEKKEECLRCVEES